MGSIQQISKSSNTTTNALDGYVIPPVYRLRRADVTSDILPGRLSLVRHSSWQFLQVQITQATIGVQGVCIENRPGRLISNMDQKMRFDSTDEAMAVIERRWSYSSNGERAKRSAGDMGPVDIHRARYQLLKARQNLLARGGCNMECRRVFARADTLICLNIPSGVSSVLPPWGS